MSSSLLLVLIVVVWAFVLAPLVVRNREPIRRTSEALGRTRLLHTGGEPVAARRRPRFSAEEVRRGADAGAEDLEMVHAEVEDPADGVDGLLIDDVDGDPGTPEVIEGELVLELEPAAAEAGDAADAEPAEPARAGGSTAASALLADAPGDAVAEVAEDDAAAEAEVGRLVEDADEPYDDDALVAAGLAPDRGAAPDADAAPESAAEDAGADDPAEPIDDDLAEEFDAELTEEDIAYARSRRGRGGYEPEREDRYAETRHIRRRRSVVGLAALAVVLAGLAGWLGGWLVWAAVAAAVLLVAYLASLRRTVVMERELRERRIRMMKRRRLGVRTSADAELGVPERLLRPGAIVVELDDEDPDFADLPYGHLDDRWGDDRHRVAG
ncbi:hypothetical protein CSPHI_09480 [Corynebacterium sphenisci DSM 44792]|uniref:Uncharacterized protein n=1 Tax=Corynebacterium sphenisci DSM 44792 TaxID=1437874 RepID=A0A1L7CZE4_9CORY|nr:gephyrin-like molybdotransferase receptor GlpR [Corynebacterium sphenisci]APT91200.1 hypothetical protein CSPHI_09480 [Corynebacterium sphenisci DSM 44792]